MCVYIYTYHFKYKPKRIYIIRIVLPSGLKNGLAPNTLPNPNRLPYYRYSRFSNEISL